MEQFRYRQPRMSDVEDVEKYAPGGYFPIDIGDVISNGDQAYEVLHKLGHGGFSTVWLVRTCNSPPKCLALKVLCAEKTDIIEGEMRALQHLRTVAGPGHPHVVVLYDSFQISGPNGQHQCLIFPVLGPTLQTVIDSTSFSNIMRHEVCQQVASALAFLHQHGVCHGDLTLSNIAFELPNVETVSSYGVSQLLGPIKTETLRQPNGERSLHAPNHVVQAADLSGMDISLLTRVRIIDFGQAFFVKAPPASLGVPIDYFPPELCFGHLPSTKSDVWQLACIIYQIHTKEYLFPTGFRIFEILVGTIMSHLGPIPKHWQGKFNFDVYGYYELGKIQSTTEPEWWFEDNSSTKTIGGQLAKKAVHLPPSVREGYTCLLNDMLRYDPEKRLSAANVIQCLQTILSVKNG